LGSGRAYADLESVGVDVQSRGGHAITCVWKKRWRVGMGM